MFFCRVSCASLFAPGEMSLSFVARDGDYSTSSVKKNTRSQVLCLSTETSGWLYLHLRSSRPSNFSTIIISLLNQQHVFESFSNIIPLPGSIIPALFISRENPRKLTIIDASVSFVTYTPCYPRNNGIWNRLPYTALQNSQSFRQLSSQWSDICNLLLVDLSLQTEMPCFYLHPPQFILWIIFRHHRQLWLHIHYIPGLDEPKEKLCIKCSRLCAGAGNVDNNPDIKCSTELDIK